MTTQILWTEKGTEQECILLSSGYVVSFDSKSELSFLFTEPKEVQQTLLIARSRSI
jgi:hypothetical protein